MPKVSDPSEELLAEATRVARRLISREDNARVAVDDLAHDVLVRALAHPPPDGGVRMGPNMGPWMERIGRNLCVDRWRAAARQPLLPIETELETPGPNSEESAIADERRRSVRRAVLALPRAQRRALILRYQAGWSFEEIAVRLGVMTATARTRVFRGLALLRRQLGALRTMLAPGSLALKPLIVALAVAAVEPSVRPVRVVPAVVEGESESRPLTLALAPHSGARGPESDADAVSRSGGDSSPGSLSRLRERGGERAVLARAAAGSTLHLDFENDFVEGELAAPDGIHVPVDPKATHPSLIELRTEFVPELLKSLENL